MIKYLVKTPTEHATARQLDLILGMEEGKILHLAFGYLRYGKHSWTEIGKVFDWLEADAKRTLSITFGLRGNFYQRSAASDKEADFIINGQGYFFKPDKNEMRQCIDSVERIFSADYLSPEIIDRVSVKASANFHAKYLLLERPSEVDGGNDVPLLLQMGSSNFTGAALHGIQTEFDICLSSENETAHTMRGAQLAAYALDKTAQKFNFLRLSHGIHKHLIEPLKNAYAQDKEALDALMARFEAERVGLAESDIEQGIAAT